MVQMEHPGTTGQAAEPAAYSQLGDCGKLPNLSFLIYKMGIIRVSVPQGCCRNEMR